MSPFDLILRATLILGAAIALAWCTRRRSADTRHALWTATFAALLLLPVATAWLPTWEVGVLPAARAEAAPDHATGLSAPDDDAPAASGTPGLAFATGTSSGRDPVSDATGDGPADPAPTSPVLEADRRGPTPASMIWLLWAAGAAVAGCSLIMGHVRFRRIVGAACRPADPGLLRELEAAAERAGVTRWVAILLSPAVQTPMTGGLRRPAIVLPDEAAGWGVERLRIVLTHELVHVARHDALRHFVGRVSMALYWFHPLTWVAARQAAISRELACDERVLLSGTRASDYAALLLDLAGGTPERPAATLSLAMIQRSQLEERLMSILNPIRPHRSVRTTVLTLATVAGVGISSAIAQPVPVVQEAAPPETTPEPLVGLPLSPELVEITKMLDVLEPLETAPKPHAPVAPRPQSATGLEAPVPALPGPPPLPVAALPQEATCELEGLNGNFSGTMHSSGGRTELSGRHDGDRMIQKYVDDLRLCMRIHGDVDMSDQMDAIESINDRDSWVVIESEGDAMARLVITRDAGGMAYAWSVDNRDHQFDAPGREWRDRMLTVLGGYWQASRLRGEQASLRGRIASYRGEVASMRGQIASHRGEVASLKGHIASQRGELTRMHGQIASHRGRISSLRATQRNATNADTRQSIEREIAQLHDRVAEIESRIEGGETDARISAIEAQIDEYDVEEKIREVESRIRDFDLDSKVTEVEREIAELDADRRAEAIESRLEGEVAALRRLLSRL